MKYIFNKIINQYLPIIGQGGDGFGVCEHDKSAEIATIRQGIDYGMTLIDTAEMYGNGCSERLIGCAIQGITREQLFIVSKVLPKNVIDKQIINSCVNSLRRLKTDYLDCYLLHWIGGCDIRYFIDSMQELIFKQLIKSFGVSNFDTPDMQALYALDNTKNCVFNQVLYSIASRGIEWDLKQYCNDNNATIMVYSPLNGGILSKGIFDNSVLRQVACKHGASVATIMLAFCILDNKTIAIPKTSKLERLKSNIKALDIVLDKDDLELLNGVFPPPHHKLPLDFC